MSNTTCNCCDNITSVQAVVWEQIKTLTLLMERMEREGDRLQEVCRQAEQDRREVRVAIIEEYLRKRILDGKRDKAGGLCGK